MAIFLLRGRDCRRRAILALAAIVALLPACSAVSSELPPSVVAYEETGPPTGNATVVRFAVIDVPSVDEVTAVVERLVDEDLDIRPHDADQAPWYDVVLGGPSTIAVAGRWKDWLQNRETASEDVVVQRRLREAVGDRDGSRLFIVVAETAR